MVSRPYDSNFEKAMYCITMLMSTNTFEEITSQHGDTPMDSRGSLSPYYTSNLSPYIISSSDNLILRVADGRRNGMRSIRKTMNPHALLNSVCA